mmetsp:Transcript_34857/g.53521  ORF Transcript_34857/g.53521 Transcript_34857/m.53521 type:complete len:179 (+) Transcript_34857:2418-2954(+)
MIGLAADYEAHVGAAPTVSRKSSIQVNDGAQESFSSEEEKPLKIDFKKPSPRFTGLSFGEASRNFQKKIGINLQASSRRRLDTSARFNNNVRNKSDAKQSKGAKQQKRGRMRFKISRRENDNEPAPRQTTTREDTTSMMSKVRFQPTSARKETNSTAPTQKTAKTVSFIQSQAVDTVS